MIPILKPTDTIWFIKYGDTCNFIDPDTIPLLNIELSKGKYIGVVDGEIAYCSNTADKIVNTADKGTIVFEKQFNGINGSEIFASTGIIHFIEQDEVLDSVVKDLNNIESSLGFKVEKYNPTSQEQLMKVINETLRQMTGVVGVLDTRYNEEIIAFLNSYNWSSISQDKIEILFREIGESIFSGLPVTIDDVMPELVGVTDAVVIPFINDIRSQLQIEGLPIISSLSVPDEKAIYNLNSIGMKFIGKRFRNNYTTLTENLKQKLFEGLESGINYRSIVDDLVSGLPNTVARRTRNILNVTAHSVINRSRSYGLLQSFNEAGITYVEFSAVLDNRTTDQCAFLDGQIVDVFSAKGYYDDITSYPDMDPEEAFPWIRSRKEGDIVRLEIPTATKPKVIASGTQGNLSWNGKYDSVKLSRNLIPPLHAFCRSTLIYT